MTLHAYTQRREVAPTVDTSAYASGDFIGTTEVELENVVNEGNGIVLQTITVIDLDGQDSALTLMFFNAEPENTTFTNNGALTIHDSDSDYYVGHVDIAAADYNTLTGSSFATVRNIGLSMDCPNDSLWVVPISKGTGTWTGAAQLKFHLVYWQD